MSQKNYNATNVPHYAPGDTPAIDLSPNANWREYLDHDLYERLDGERQTQARFAQQQIARRRYVNAKFPPGTRFTLTRLEENIDRSVRREDFPQDMDGARAWLQAARKAGGKRVTYTGVVRYMTKATWHGCAVVVLLDPDSPRTRESKSNSRNGSFGLSTFADAAKRVIRLMPECACVQPTRKRGRGRKADPRNSEGRGDAGGTPGTP